MAEYDEAGQGGDSEFRVTTMIAERGLIDEAPGADAFIQAFIMIVVSEIGDKTFLIAAIMATRHARGVVFSGAFASLVVMSILSAALGRILLGLIPKVWTLWAAAILFLGFGLKMLQEARSMAPGSGHMQEEMREVEEELEEDSSRHDIQNPKGESIPLEAVEEGRLGDSIPSLAPRSPIRRSSSVNGGPDAPRSGPSISFPLSKTQDRKRGGFKDIVNQARNSLQLLTNPVFAQAFIMTFLGEWGDRSQITTIAMAGAHSVPVIAFGTILGHGLCTMGAVVAGRYLSSKISVKHITLIGATAFLIFAMLYVGEAWYAVPDELPAMAMR